MKTDDLQISSFFLSMFKHDLTNGVSNLYQLGKSAIDTPNLDEGIRQDLKYDHEEALDNSLTALNKLHTLLYTKSISKTKKQRISDCFNAANKLMPFSPTKITLNESQTSNQDYPAEATTQILHSVFQLIIRNEDDSFENGISIAVSTSKCGSISVSYSGVTKFDLFTDLSKCIERFTKKSKIALEYEFLKHLVFQEAINIITDDSSVSFQLTL